ncbi:uncharacterized protein V6R79_003988 [Siganus canaliculatus]
MFDLTKDWSISFAGCGFMGVYYIGATSCILERFPRFIHGASKIYGSSSGSVMAAILSVGVPLEKCCADLMSMAREARKHRLGPLHPAFNLLRIVKDSLVRSLPEDAHLRASGKLCVSLTRVSDGKNVLASEFGSREELIQALLCSCHVPFYCGIIPPTFRGVHYVDGAVSDNHPQSHVKNTITISAYAGESDLCPRGSTLNFHEVRFNNMSIQVNSENVYRVTSTFFPPEPEAMAEICHNGYTDALRFLQENNLISTECPQRSLEVDPPKPACCELAKEMTEDEESSERKQQNEEPSPQEKHWWLDPRLIEKLPVHIKQVFCDVCREANPGHAGGLLSHVTEFLPKNVSSYLQIPSFVPVESARSLAQRLMDWIPDSVPREVSWLYRLSGGLYQHAQLNEEEGDADIEVPLRRCTSLPSGLNLSNQRKEDAPNHLPLTPEATPTSGLTFTWNTQTEADLGSLTPPPTPPFSPTSGFGEAETAESSSGGWAVGRAVGWLRNMASEQPSNHRDQK